MKNKKRRYAVLLVIGVLMIIGGIVAGVLMPETGKIYAIYYCAVGAVLIAIGAFLMMRKEKPKAEGEGEQLSSATAATSEQTELVVPPLPSGVEVYIEQDGKNLYELFGQGENLSSVTLVCPDEKLRTYDYLWFKTYGEHSFCVLGYNDTEEDGSPVYVKMLFRLVEGDGETGLVLEEDEGVCAVVQRDFDRVAEEYAKSQTNPSKAVPATGGSIAVQYVDKESKKSFFVLTAIYLLVLIAGLIGHFTAFGITDEQQAAICGAICLSYVVVTPSYFIYLSACNPFNFNGVVRQIIKWVAVAVMIVLAIINITAIPDNIEYEGFWGFIMNIFIPAAPFVATFCYYAVYCWWCHDAPSRIFLIFGLAVTVLFPVATALLMIYLVLTFIIAAIKWILSSIGIMAADTNLGKGFISGWTGKSFEKTYTIRDEHGYEHTVTSSDGIHFYGDGVTYISDDGGNTIRRS